MKKWIGAQLPGLWPVIPEFVLVIVLTTLLHITGWVIFLTAGAVVFAFSIVVFLVRVFLLPRKVVR